MLQQPIITTKKSSGENECRRVLENIFNLPFISSRPDFLKNPITKSYNLELDCYNKDLHLAVEYNGKQHYEYTPYFHKSMDAFRNQQYRDDIKKRLCLENNVNLIIIPYTVKISNIKQFLIKELKKINS